jgi:uncharacterized protein (DUF302 family)
MAQALGSATITQASAFRENGQMAAPGLTTVRSKHSFKDTLDKLEAEVKARGIEVFARIDHAAGASSVGLPLRPTTVLVFGNAKAGTPLMQADQAAGIDLPLKALVYEDASGAVWLAYNDPHWIAQRHGLGANVAATVDALAKVLASLVAKATA